MRFVLDTQIYIHYKLFTDCDWKSLLESDELKLLIIPTVLREIDEMKFDPREHKKKRAREINAKFREILRDKPLPNGVIAEFAIPLSGVEYNANGLKESISDDKIIAEILALKKQGNTDELCLITDDLGMELKAKAYGIKVLSPPYDWIRETKDPRDKKIKELEDFITKNYPELNLWLYTKDAHPVETLEVSIGYPVEKPLSDEDLVRGLSELEEENKKKLKAVSAPQVVPRFSESVIERYEKDLEFYLDNYKRYLIVLKQTQEELSSIMRIPLILINSGGRPAEDIDVRMTFPRDVVLLKDFPENPEEPEEPTSA